MMKFALLFFVAVTAAYALTHFVGKLPADCDPIAEQLASWELGNYAEPEERAPAVERWQQQCSDASINRDEAVCLDKARTRYAAAKCAPRLFPDLAVSDCEGAACALEKYREMTDKLCACATPDCMTRVTEGFSRWAAEYAKEHGNDADFRNPDPDVAAEMKAIAEKMSRCMQRIAQAAQPPNAVVAD